MAQGFIDSLVRYVVGEEEMKRNVRDANERMETLDRLNAVPGCDREKQQYYYQALLHGVSQRRQMAQAPSAGLLHTHANQNRDWNGQMNDMLNRGTTCFRIQQMAQSMQIQRLGMVKTTTTNKE